MADRGVTTEDAEQRILEHRARALAAPLSTEESTDDVELVLVVLGADRYGVAADRVREVRPLTALTPVPGAPPVWAGIVNVRGTLYPVLDLHRYLQLPPRKDHGDGASEVVLVSAGRLSIGLMVDAAPGVRRLPAGAIGPPLAGSSETVTNTVRGVTDDLLAVLDVEALLSDPRLVVREEPK